MLNSMSTLERRGTRDEKELSKTISGSSDVHHASTLGSVLGEPGCHWTKEIDGVQMKIFLEPNRGKGKRYDTRIVVEARTTV